MQHGLGTATIVATLVSWAGSLLLATLVGATPLRDPLCARVAIPAGYNCASVRPSAAALLKPGDLIDSNGARIGALDSSACRIPGAPPLPYVIATAPLASSRQQLSYSALGALSRGGVMNAALPAGQTIRLDGGLDGDLDGGWNALRRIDVQVADLSRASIDTTTALTSLASCSIRPRCIDELRSGRTRLVTGTLASARIDYQLRDGRGVLSDALARQLLPHSGLQTVGRGALRAVNSLVVGTQSLAKEPLRAQHVCELPFGFEVAGSAEAVIAGHGGRGAFGDHYVKQNIGVIAQLFAQGSEVSDCDADLGREKSRGYAQAQLEQTHAGGLHLAGEIRATSGRYRFGRCNTGRRLPNNNTLANTAMARVHIAGTLDVMVRYEQRVDIELRWHGTPAGTMLRVLGPDGATLLANQAIEADGSQRLRVLGPGVFHVLPTVDARLQRKGESGVKSLSFNATLEAKVTPVEAG